MYTFFGSILVTNKKNVPGPFAQTSLCIHTFSVISHRCALSKKPTLKSFFTRTAEIDPTAHTQDGRSLSLGAKIQDAGFTPVRLTANA